MKDKANSSSLERSLARVERSQEKTSRAQEFLPDGSKCRRASLSELKEELKIWESFLTAELILVSADT
jgi:hypothetical protein